MTKEEQAHKYSDDEIGCPVSTEASIAYHGFLAGYEAAIRDRDSDLKEAMKQAVREVLNEIKHG